jgi:ATP:ADP antiporter, AAA family
VRSAPALRPAGPRTAPAPSFILPAGHGLAHRRRIAASAAAPGAAAPPPGEAGSDGGGSIARALGRATAKASRVTAKLKAGPFSSRKFLPMVLLCVWLRWERRGGEWGGWDSRKTQNKTSALGEVAPHAARNSTNRRTIIITHAHAHIHHSFFFMSFNNTVLDSLANSLVITASGGGTQVIPFLTVYAVWPCSILFLIAYSAATQRLARRHLFNAVLGSFLAFYAGFALLYPSHEAIHFGGMATAALAWLPPGLAGAVGMVRNWLFTAFYCTAELWGDIVLSLLFWGLANETTHMDEAPALYPLFGIGANIGQTVSGKALSMFHRATDGLLSDVAQVQAMMAVVLGCGLTALALHAHIVKAFPPDTEGDEPGAAVKAVCGEVVVPTPAASTPAPAVDPAACVPPPPDHPSLRQAFAFLARSPQIRCLAVMALAQGLAANLIEIAWKSQVHLLHPSPAAYAAVMGDVAMWTGIVTGSLMLLSPSLFRAWKWRGVAGATPKFMLVAGLPFFVGSAVYAWAHPAAGAGGAALAPGAARWLAVLVAMGALLQVFAKGAKFSMFKPAEEMVYIGLDEQSRTKGKAAIDVVGAQTGKSAGSVLQQVLLVASAGSMASSLPFMAAAFLGILLAWTAAVDRLDRLHVCAFSGELKGGGVRDLSDGSGGSVGGGSEGSGGGGGGGGGGGTNDGDGSSPALNGVAPNGVATNGFANGAANGAAVNGLGSSAAAAAA